VADMYRGLVQHGAYITPYLREQTLNRNLLLPVNRGRIWRIAPEAHETKKISKMGAFTLIELVNTLFNQNGWHRDMAQRLLIERNDPESIPLLWEAIYRYKGNWGRIHALWTLEGLRELDLDKLTPLLSDPDPYVSATALRLLEPFVQKNPKLEPIILSSITKASLSSLNPFVLQLTLSANMLLPTLSSEILGRIITLHGESPLIRDALLSGLEKGQFNFLQSLLQNPEWVAANPEREIVIEMLTGSVITKGDPKEVGQLLTFLDKNPPSDNWKYRPILTALTIGGNTRVEPIPMPRAPKLLIAAEHDTLSPLLYAALARLFTWPGHHKLENSAMQTISLNPDEQKQFALGRQHYLSTCSGCHGNAGEGVNRMAPPLAGSEWVVGDKKQLSLIVLHGMEGPLDVKGKIYDIPDILPVMPAHTSLDDGTLSAILTYIRNEWGNSAGAVERRFIATTRNVTQGRVIPWSAEELKTYIQAEQEKSP
jgi:mono/diheme cytochrome c family protein